MKRSLGTTLAGAALILTGTSKNLDSPTLDKITPF